MAGLTCIHSFMHLANSFSKIEIFKFPCKIDSNKRATYDPLKSFVSVT